jgi:hypothetical protein
MLTFLLGFLGLRIANTLSIFRHDYNLKLHIRKCVYGIIAGSLIGLYIDIQLAKKLLSWNPSFIYI